MSPQTRRGRRGCGHASCCAIEGGAAWLTDELDKVQAESLPGISKRVSLAHRQPKHTFVPLKPRIPIEWVVYFRYAP